MNRPALYLGQDGKVTTEEGHACIVLVEDRYGRWVNIDDRAEWIDANDAGDEQEAAVSQAVGEAVRELEEELELANQQGNEAVSTLLSFPEVREAVQALHVADQLKLRKAIPDESLLP